MSVVNSVDCLWTIASFLPLQDLKAFAHSSRQLRRAADLACMWRSALLSHCGGDFSLFSEPWTVRVDLRLPWKQLALQCLSVQQKQSATDSSLTANGQLWSGLWQVLMSPDLPVIPLRASNNVVESFYMELLTASLDAFHYPREDPLESVLDAQAEELYQEVDDPLDIQSTLAGMGSPSSARILQLYSAFTGSVTFHCAVTAAILSEAASSHDFLVAYNQRWSGYCASMQAATGTYQCLFDILLEMAEARLPTVPTNAQRSVLGLMTQYWKSAVYDVLKDRINTAACEVLREVLVAKAGTRDQRAEELRNTMRNLMDLSTDARSCHFAGHSQYRPGAPYQALESQMVEITVSELTKNVRNPMTLSTVMENAGRLVDFITLPCTAAKIESALLDVETELAYQHFFPCVEKTIPTDPAECSNLAVFFTAFLGLGMTKYAGSVERYLQTCGTEEKRYIEALKARVGPTEEDGDWGPDALLEARKNRLGLHFADVVVC